MLASHLSLCAGSSIAVNSVKMEVKRCSSSAAAQCLLPVLWLGVEFVRCKRFPQQQTPAPAPAPARGWGRGE